MLNKNMGVYFDLRYFCIIYSRYLDRDTVFNIEHFFNFVRYEVSAYLNIPMNQCEVNKNEVHFYIGGTANTDGERWLEDALVKARLGNNIHRLPLFIINGTEKKEKGVDLRLALDAYKSAIADKYDVLVLITGDADFVPLVEDIKGELNKPVFLFFWDEIDTKTRTAQPLIDSVTKPFAMHELMRSRVTTNPFAKGLLQPMVKEPQIIRNGMTPSTNLRTLLVETANECPQGENGWMLGADFGLILKKVKKHDPKEDGKRLADLFQDHLDLFEIRPEPPLAVRLRNKTQSSAAIPSSVQTAAEVSTPIPRQLTPREKAMDYESIIVLINQEQNFGFINSPWRFINEKMNNFAFSPSDLQNPGNKGLDRGVRVKFNLSDDAFRSLKFGVPLYKAVNVIVLD